MGIGAVGVGLRCVRALWILSPSGVSALCRAMSSGRSTTRCGRPFGAFRRADRAGSASRRLSVPQTPRLARTRRPGGSVQKWPPARDLSVTTRTSEALVRLDQRRVARGLASASRLRRVCSRTPVLCRGSSSAAGGTWTRTWLRRSPNAATSIARPLASLVVIFNQATAACLSPRPLGLGFQAAAVCWSCQRRTPWARCCGPAFACGCSMVRWCTSASMIRICSPPAAAPLCGSRSSTCGSWAGRWI